jgi:hypothetical protein
MRTAIMGAALILGVVLIAAACGDGVTPNPPPRFPTATPTPSATPSATETEVGETPTPTYTTQIADYVEIYRVKYNGIKLYEPDEYVVIRNTGDEDVNMQGWELVNLTKGYPTFTFPFFILNAHTKIRVYTDEYWPDHFQFDWPEEIWNNSVPDTAALYDAKGRLISNRSYELID